MLQVIRKSDILLMYSFVLQVMVAALKFFLGSDPEDEKDSDDSESDVTFLCILYLLFSLYVKELNVVSIHESFNSS
jgi:hypothetical protein